MTVYKRDGKWRVQVDVGNDPITGKRKREPGGSFRTKREATAAESKMKADRERGLLGITTRSTVGEYLEVWLAHKLSGERLASTTQANYIQLIRKHIAPRIGGVPLAKLTPAQAQHFEDTLLTNGGLQGGPLSSSRVRAIHQLLGAALDFAVRKGFLTRNIMDAVDQPKLVVRKHSLWTIDQIDRFLIAAAAHPMAAMWWLAVMGGLRRGELLGMHWADVHLDEGYVYVHDTRVKKKATKGGEKKGPKSDAGTRVVTLGPETLAALRSHQARQRETRLKGNIVWQDNDLVFCRDDGKSFYPDTPSAWFVDFISALRLPRISLHDLRKIHASLASVASQGDARSVSDRLGHSRVDTTQTHYVKGLVERQRSIADGVETLVRARKST